MELSESEVNFIWDRLKRIERMSDCKLRIKKNTLNFNGDEQAEKLARKYVRISLSQRKKSYLEIDEDKDDDDDLCMLSIPQSTAGFVCGSKGAFINALEKENDTMMSFITPKSREKEDIAIFGKYRNRLICMLKIMSSVENKISGYYTKDNVDGDDDELNQSKMKLEENQISYALGKMGSTRRKLAESSGCIIEYLGSWVYLIGTKDEREKAKLYIRLLFQQLKGPIDTVHAEHPDAVVIDLPQELIGFIAGHKRETLSRVEKEWGCMIFFYEPQPGYEKLLVFHHDHVRRKGAELKLKSQIESKKKHFLLDSFYTDFTPALEMILKCCYTFNKKDFVESDAKEYHDFMAENKHRLLEHEGIHDEVEGYALDCMNMEEDNLSYALGRNGSTKRKIANSLGCVLEYIGSKVCIYGTKDERIKCREYLGFLISQKGGGLIRIFEDVDGLIERDDLDILEVSRRDITHLNAHKGYVLREVEAKTNTFCFVGIDRHGVERLFIFGKSDDRHSAIDEFNYQLDEAYKNEKRRRDDFRRSYSRSKSYRRYDKRRSYSR